MEIVPIIQKKKLSEKIKIKDILDESNIKDFNINKESVNNNEKDEVNLKYNNNPESKDLFLKSLNTNTIHNINNMNNEIIEYDMQSRR